MKRLSELIEDDDPLHRQAAQLLGAVDALPASEERMRRVRRGMEEKRKYRGSAWRGPRALVFATGLLVFAGSTLAAAQTGVFRAVIASVSSAVESAAPSATEPKRDNPNKRRNAGRASERHAVASTQPAAAESPVASAVILNEPPASAVPTPAPLPAASATSKREGVRHQVRETALAEDSELVRRAVKALRRDHDAALAARLLEQARARSPHGALAEEVLSLRVEAALLRKDARAAAYAREYLSEYPTGRYRARVEQALR